jgi:hypothetical protein
VAQRQWPREGPGGGRDLGGRYLVQTESAADRCPASWPLQWPSAEATAEWLNGNGRAWAPRGGRDLGGRYLVQTWSGFGAYCGLRH